MRLAHSDVIDMKNQSEHRTPAPDASRITQGIQIARCMISCLHRTLYGLVLQFFVKLNRQVDTHLTPWYMEQETTAHFQLLVMTFKWLILPASVLYIFIGFWYLGVNTIDSTFWGLMLFVYSNFLPDLPAVFCRYQPRQPSQVLSASAQYLLLLFAPFFVWLVFSGISIPWQPRDTFHDITATALYALFLLGLGMAMFGVNIEACVFPLYGIAGYLTHLRVDQIS